MMRKVSVIIPVYDGMEETRRCISSVLASIPLQQTKVDLIIINDFSPCSLIAEYLREIENSTAATLISNAKNKGFVATANIGMKLNINDDVILLNSDTEVANNWVDRLVDAAYQQKEIGTVTPLSNNAEICSFPVLCADNDLPLGLCVHELDKQIASLSGLELIDIPTAVGFCMYIKRGCLNEVGYFDEATFGRGYGEENDFCRRAIKQKWRHVLSPNVFVFHEGGVSFSDEKAERIQYAMTTLDRLYPDYHHAVHEHIQADPAKASRLSILIRLYSNSTLPVVLHVTHHLGGGTNKYIDDLSDLNTGKLNALVLQRGQEGWLTLYFGNLKGECIHFSMSQGEVLRGVLAYLNVSYAHLHHVMDVPELVFEIIASLSLPYDITLHDYYFINANPTLTDSKGRYCADIESRDSICGIERAVPNGLTAQSWREKQSLVLKGAERVLSPTNATRDIYFNYFSDIQYKVIPHTDWEQFGKYPSIEFKRRRPQERLRVLVLGALSREKGGDLLEKTAKISSSNKYEFHLLGYAFKPLSAPVIEHGAYQDADLAGLIDEIDPHVIWFPCLWPETYCYTLSAALRSGLPIVATDIGSFPERIAGRPCSWLKSWQTTPEQWMCVFEQLDAEVFSCTEDESVEWLNQTQCSLDKTFYRNDYVLRITELRDLKKSQPDNICVDLPFVQLQLKKYQQSTGHMVGRKEKLLLLLMKLRSNRLMGRVARLVPFGVQRAIKRRLSRAPMHDIVNKINNK